MRAKATMVLDMFITINDIIITTLAGRPGGDEVSTILIAHSVQNILQF